MRPEASTRPATSLPRRPRPLGNFLGVFIKPKSALAKAYPRQGGSVLYLRPRPASPEAPPSATTSRLTRSSSLYPSRSLPSVRRILPPRPAVSSSPRPSPPLARPDRPQTETSSATIPVSPAATPSPDGDSDSDVSRALIGDSASGTMMPGGTRPRPEEELEGVVESAAVEDAPGGEEDAVGTEDDASTAPPDGAAQDAKAAARPASAASSTRAASSTSTPPSPHTYEPSPELCGGDLVQPFVVKLARSSRPRKSPVPEPTPSPRGKRVRKSTQAMVESIAQRDLDDDVLIPKAEPEDDRPARALKRARRDPEERGREVARGTERTREMSARGSSGAPEVLEVSLSLPEPVVKPRAPRDPNSGKTCHHDKNRSKTPKMSCTTPGCTLLWCQRCVNKHYNGPTDPPFVAEGKFLCPVCRGACRCAFHRHKRGSGSLTSSNMTSRKKRPREDALDEIDAENETLVKRGKRRALDVDMGPDNFRDSLLALQREAVVLPGSVGEVSDTSGDEYEYEYGDEYGDEGEEDSGDESGDGLPTSGTSVTFSDGRSSSASGPRLFREDDPTPVWIEGPLRRRRKTLDGDALLEEDDEVVDAAEEDADDEKEFAILANVLDPDLFPPAPPKTSTEPSSLHSPADSTAASPVLDAKPTITPSTPAPTLPAGPILPQAVAVPVPVPVATPHESSQPATTPPVATLVAEAPTSSLPPPPVALPACQASPPLFPLRPFPPTPNYASQGADVWAPTHVPTSAVPLSPPLGSPPRTFLPHRFPPGFSPRPTPHAPQVENHFARRPNSAGGAPPPGGGHAISYRPPPVPRPSYVPSHYASSTPPTIHSHSRPQTTTPMMLVPAGADLEQHRFGPQSMYSHKDLDLLTNEELGLAVRQVLNSGPDFYAAASMAFSTVISHRHSSSSSSSSSLSSIPVPGHPYFANEHVGRRSPAPSQPVYAHHRYTGGGVGDESSFLSDHSLLSEYVGTPFRHGSVGPDVPFADAGRSIGGAGVGASSPSAAGGIPPGHYTAEGTTEDPWKAALSGGEGATVGVGPSWSSVGWGE